MSEESMAPSAPVESAPAAPAPQATESAPQSAASLLATNNDPAPVQTAAPQSDPVQTGTEQTGTFYDGVSEESRGFFENKKFTDLDAVAKSYKNLEAMKGVPENELLRIPKAEDADGLAEMYNRLGRPEKAADYTLEGVEDGDWFREVAHKSGLNESQAMEIIKGYDAQLATASEQADAKYMQDTQVQMDELKKDWGVEFDANGEFAQIAAKKFGVNDEQLSQLERAMGTKGLMNFMAKLGRATSEGSYADGSDSSPVKGDLGKTPAAAKDALDRLMGDPEWKARYMSKDAAIRTQAMKERSDLSKLAYDQEQ